MSSIIRVDTLQKPDGSTPTAADLGIDVSGSVIQVVTDVFGTETAHGGTSRFYPVEVTLNAQAGSKIVVQATVPVFTPASSGAWATMAFWGMDWDTGSGWTTFTEFEHDAYNITNEWSRTLTGVMSVDVAVTKQYKFRVWVQNYNSNAIAYFNRGSRNSCLVATEIAQ